MKLVNDIQSLLERLSPLRILERRMDLIEDLRQKKPLFCLSIGKASSHQFKAFNEKLTFEDALIITKKDHGLSELSSITHEAAHPYPDESSLKSFEMIQKFLNSIPSGSHVLVLLSGGASSLVCAPIDPFSLNELNRINKDLITKGASIFEINQIRKSLSSFKNGGLIDLMPDCHYVSFAISDIPSEDENLSLDLIGSAPTKFSMQNLSELKEISTKYFSKELLEKYLSYIENKNFSKKSIDSEIKIFSSYKDLSLESKNLFKDSLIIERPFSCTLEKGLKDHLDLLRENPRKSLISFGEMDVLVEGDGLGGRNMEFVLRASKEIFYKNSLALEISDLKRIQILSLGTDGSDGPTDAAGAYFDYELAKKFTLYEVESSLKNNDSYHFFKRAGSLIKTGPTGTNLMDIRMIHCL